MRLLRAESHHCKVARLVADRLPGWCWSGEAGVFGLVAMVADGLADGVI